MLVDEFATPAPITALSWALISRCSRPRRTRSRRQLHHRFAAHPLAPLYAQSAALATLLALTARHLRGSRRRQRIGFFTSGETAMAMHLPNDHRDSAGDTEWRFVKGKRPCGKAAARRMAKHLLGTFNPQSALFLFLRVTSRERVHKLRRRALFG